MNMYYGCVEYVYCVYIPEFPAWAARQAGAAAPVVVVSGGRVVARERVRSLRNVVPGDRADRVKGVCASATVCVRDIHTETTCWESLLRRVHDLTPFMETTGPPFLFFRQPDESVLRTWISGTGLQVGTGEGRAMARLAALRATPGHVLRVSPNREQRFLDGFHVRRLTALGVPPGVTEQMELYGHMALGSFRRLTLRHLKAQFGRHGEFVHSLIHPTPDSPITTWRPPPSVVAAHSWPESVPASEQMLQPVIGDVVARVVDALGARRTQCIGLLLDVAEGPPGDRSAHSVMRRHILQEPVHRAETIRHATWRLLREVIGPAGCHLDGLQLHLEALQQPAVHQKDFFDARPAIRNAVRTIQKRYPGVLRKVRLRPHAVFDEDRTTLESIEPDGPSDD